MGRNRPLLISLSLHFGGLALLQMGQAPLSNFSSEGLISIDLIHLPPEEVRMIHKPPAKPLSRRALAQSSLAPSTAQASAREEAAAIQAPSPKRGRGQSLHSIQKRIRAHTHYPPLLKRRGIEGTAQIHLTLLANGELEQSRIRHSSGHAGLDHAALEGVRRAAPFGRLAFSEKKLNLVVPVQFRLRGVREHL